MSYIQQIENEDHERNYNPADRFAGFDRGDAGRDAAYDVDCGERIIGRLTSEAGQRIVVRELWHDDLRAYEVLVDGNCVYSDFDAADRERALTVGRWWLAGCPA